MQLKKFSFADTHAFSSFFLDYIEQNEKLKPFYHRFPTADVFTEQIKDKQQSYPSSHRSVLADSLTSQYSSLTVSEAVDQNINALRDSNTFTITTGHQLNIFTGPLYFIYKIVTVINTSKVLKEKYPECNFVPVFWMASEDHDYDEIKYFRLYGKKYVWHTSQTGAVGKFSPNGLAALANEIPGDNHLFNEAYSKHATLSDAVRFYVNALFGDQGLVIIDADDGRLKSLWKNVIHDDIFNGINKSCVDETTKELEDLGYKTQVFCREINFFYLDNNIRSRIEKLGDTYTVVDTDITFTPDELKALIESNPERFSPNVILRPLYQETILPNLAYIGGPAEVVYWLQLKKVFQNFGIPFPVLMPRSFAMVVDHEVFRKFKKTGLEWRDVFEEKNYLFNHWVLKFSPRNLTVGVERNAIGDLFQQIKDRAELVDKTLSPFVGAEGKRAINSLEKIERRLLRAEKRLHGDKLKQIEFIKDRLFPNGSLQERTDNFLNFYQQDPQFIHKLLNTLDPFDFRFNVLIDED